MQVEFRKTDMDEGCDTYTVFLGGLEAGVYEASTGTIILDEGIEDIVLRRWEFIEAARKQLGLDFVPRIVFG